MHFQKIIIISKCTLKICACNCNVNFKTKQLSTEIYDNDIGRNIYEEVCQCQQFTLKWIKKSDAVMGVKREE